MNPTDVGKSYDQIAARWRSPASALTGLPQHKLALKFVETPRHALDVGCGCNGRFLDLLRSRGITVEGVDLSAEMISLARARDPEISFSQADIRDWPLPRRYDFITGWDSIWHVPLADQPAVLKKLCQGLEVGGVLIFSLGGTDTSGEIFDEHMGVPMYHATLGIPRTLDILAEFECVIRHLEFDQLPEQHAFIIAQRRAAQSSASFPRASQ